jgi:hypothetical protein
MKKPTEQRSKRVQKSILWVLGLAAAGIVTGAVGYYLPGVLHRIGNPSTPPPLVATVEMGVGDYAYRPWWLFPGDGPPPSTLPARLKYGIGGDDYTAWARGRGAIGAHHLIFRVVLRAARDEPVIVNGFDVMVVNRRSPSTGWYTGGGGCGAVPVRAASIDLDKIPPKVQYKLEEHGDYSSSMTLRVAKEDPEVIDVIAWTTTSDIEWVFDIAYESGGKSQLLRIDDGGKPFRVSAITKEASRRYEQQGGVAPEPYTLVRVPERDGDPSIC